MIPYCKTFSLLFKKYRLRAEFATLCAFGKALADEGFIYEDSIFSRWQKGSRVPQNRSLLITIVKIFMETGSIASLKEANMFLESTGHGYLTDSELKNLYQPNKLHLRNRRRGICYNHLTIDNGRV